MSEKEYKKEMKMSKDRHLKNTDNFKGQNDEETSVKESKIFEEPREINQFPQGNNWTAVITSTNVQVG